MSTPGTGTLVFQPTEVPNWNAVTYNPNDGSVQANVNSGTNTGGQACTSGFLGQVSDMAEYGPGQRGKEETRKELALLAVAHRNVFVVQSSQASPSHLLAGVLKGLRSRHPAVFSLHCPCPPEHGLADDSAPHAARLSLESRAFPLLVYDPAAGPRMGDRLSLDGNPSVDEPLPTYELKYVDDGGAEQTMELPVTIADWAATESRFRKHFTRLAGAEEELVPFHEFLAQAPDERAGRKPFIYTLEADRRLGRLAVSDEVVRLGDGVVAVGRRVGVAQTELRKVGADGDVQIQPAFLGQPHDERAQERLGDRPDLEERGLLHRKRVVDARDPECGGQVPVRATDLHDQSAPDAGRLEDLCCLAGPGSKRYDVIC